MATNCDFIEEQVKQQPLANVPVMGLQEDKSQEASKSEQQEKQQPPANLYQHDGILYNIILQIILVLPLTQKKQ